MAQSHMSFSVISFCRGAALGLCALALSVPAFATDVTSENNGARIQLASTEAYHSVEPPDDADQWYVGSIPDEPYDIPKIDRSRLRADLRRETVSAPEDMPANTIVVDIDNRHLFFYPGDGTAIRYGIGVGRRGFSWQGNASVGRKGVWPDWIPTQTMRALIPNLPASMEGGLDSPLGARALYLYKNGQDILFRIHGTNEPWTIGEQVSSGCIRMLNEDVADLYNRVEIGAKVILRNSKYASTRVSQSE
ncbi:MAG: L,D-transpeptidase [Hyphomicrobiales bacterium]